MARVSYLLDTNIISEPLATKPNDGVLERIKVHGTDLAITSITWQELLYGMLLLPAGRRRERIEDYLLHRVRPSLPILSFDATAARWQAEQRARLRSMGQTPPIRIHRSPRSRSSTSPFWLRATWQTSRFTGRPG